MKVPIFIQGSIHGNEYEGVDAVMRTIERLATTPYGEDPQVDAWLDHAVLVFNVIQNPDGRIAGTRANSNGFDLNRDYITQSQPETRLRSVSSASGSQPGSTTCMATSSRRSSRARPSRTTRVSSTTSGRSGTSRAWTPTRPGWRARASASPGRSTTFRLSWIPEGETLPQGWDDWGPFYTGQYGQLRGLDAMTVETCNELGTACGIDGQPAPAGRPRSARCGRMSSWSTPRVDFLVENRREMLYDQYEIYRRGKEDAAASDADRPAALPGHARGSQLHDALSTGARDPRRGRPAQRRGGQAARRLPARQRHRGQAAATRLPLRQQDLRRRARMSCSSISRCVRSATRCSTSATTSPTA